MGARMKIDIPTPVFEWEVYSIKINVNNPYDFDGVYVFTVTVGGELIFRKAWHQDDLTSINDEWIAQNVGLPEFGKWIARRLVGGQSARRGVDSLDWVEGIKY